MRKRRSLGWLAAILLFAVPATAGAQGVVVDFNGLTPGSVVTSTGGIGFSYVPLQSQLSGFPLIVSSGFAASSGARYLGVQDGRSEFFQPGDRVDLTFGSPVTRVDVTFVAPKGAPAGAFGLRSGATTVSSTNANAVVLSTGDTAITLHLTTPAPVLSAQAFSNSLTAPRYSLDDVVVPEPGLGAMLSTGLGGLVGLVRVGAFRRRVGPASRGR
jgi:hypothetical protein